MTPSQQEFDLVNAVLRECIAQGAYNLGIACAIAWNSGHRIDADLLSRAAECPTAPEALETARAWTEERNRERQGR